MIFKKALSTLVKLLVVVSVMVIAGCQQALNVSLDQKSKEELAGPDLVGAQGKTVDDQIAIDVTVAGFCKARAWTPEQCQEHQDSSDDRWREFGGRISPAPGAS